MSVQVGILFHSINTQQPIHVGTRYFGEVQTLFLVISVSIHFGAGHSNLESFLRLLYIFSVPFDNESFILFGPMIPRR